MLSPNDMLSVRNLNITLFAEGLRSNFMTSSFRDLPFWFRASFKLSRIFRSVIYKLVSEADLPEDQLTDRSARIILKQWEHEYLTKEIDYHEN